MKGISNLAQKNPLIPSQQRFDDENGANEEKNNDSRKCKKLVDFCFCLSERMKKKVEIKNFSSYGMRWKIL